MNYKYNFVLSALAVGLFGAMGATAADKVYLQDNPNYRSALAASPSSMLVTSQAALSSSIAASLNLAPTDELEPRRTYKDSDGSTTVRYQQKYRGIPVIGDDVIIARHSNGIFKTGHGAVLNGIASDVVDISARLTDKQALAIAKRRSAASASLQGKKAPTVEAEHSRLAIWQDESGVARLVYEVTYMQHGDEPSRPYMLIDAKTGSIIHQYDNLQTANATGPGGNLKTGQYFYGTDFGYMNVTQSGSTCTMSNANVKTVNLNHGTSGSTAFSFTCPQNTVKSINGAYSPLNDAHFFGGVVFDMFNAWVGSPPLTFQLQMRVHYSNNYENAFWNGTAMTFGDGASTFYPLVSLDVSAHEVSHGFTEQNSNLVYSGKPGGLNESFSDMSGEAAENFMNGTNDWKVGAQIFKGSGALRYMDNPPLDGRSIGHQSDFTTGMDVHYSSGVFNKAFYLLATTSGWNTQKAFQIYARANQLYWTASTNWDIAGNGVLDAACDLSFDVAAVQASLTAVGINSTVSNPVCGGTPPPPPGNNVLTKGVPVSGLSASTGSDVMYTMVVPAGATGISFTTSGGTGDADLYVRFGAAPTDTLYDCRPYSAGNNETCNGTASGGTYYVRVKAYSSFSGVTLVGNYTEPGTGPVPINETVSNISVSSGQWKYYSVTLAAGYSNFTAKISGGSGDADLYVRRGSQPTTASFDCRPYKWGNSETCSFSNPASATWYIGIRGYSAASGVTLNYTATP